jgi:hypothetical protein
LKGSTLAPFDGDSFDLITLALLDGDVCGHCRIGLV